MAVGGDLQDMDVSSLIAVNCNQMNQARLQIWHRGSKASVFFEDGNIAHMTLDSQEGEEVIAELLSWTDGTFRLERGVPAPQRTVTCGWSELLLRGMQRVDERSIPARESTLRGIDGARPGEDAPDGKWEPGEQELQAVLDEFGSSATTVVACAVASMPEGDVLAAYPSFETALEAATHLARALEAVQQAASKMEWGAVAAMTVVMNSFTLQVFVIAEGKAYVGIVSPREVMPAIVSVAFDKFRHRLERAIA